MPYLARTYSSLGCILAFMRIHLRIRFQEIICAPLEIAAHFVAYCKKNEIQITNKKMKTLDRLSGPIITLIFTISILSLFNALAQYIERNGL